MNAQAAISLADIREMIATQFEGDKKKKIVSNNGGTSEWVFNFRPLLMNPLFLHAVSGHLWRRLQTFAPIQIGGMESAAIPLVTGIALRSLEAGTPVKSFYIRKSRKPTEFQRIVEGAMDDSRVVLVDDVLSSGTSMMRQIDIMEQEGKKVFAVCTIIRYHELSFYKHLTDRGVQIFSLFTLADFPGVKYVIPEKPAPIAFETVWKFADAEPNYFHINAKSAPTLDDTKLYFGADDGFMRALDQHDGRVVWQHKITLGDNGKYIFSSPAVHDGVVYFGAYDGEVYALAASDGSVIWKFSDSEWVASSPALAPDIGLLFIGLEQGLSGRHGALVALDMVTGQKKWWYEMPAYVAASPLYIPQMGIVVCGCNDGVMRAFEAVSGRLLWSFATKAELQGLPGFDAASKILIFGSMDGTVYIVRANTGELVHAIVCDAGVVSTPVQYEGRAYFGSLDKCVYCIDIGTGSVLWKFRTNGRIFASPVLYEDVLYIGSNDGWLYMLDPRIGKPVGFMHTTERIVNRIAINNTTGRFFLPTHACEISCLIKKGSELGFSK